MSKRRIDILLIDCGENNQEKKEVDNSNTFDFSLIRKEMMFFIYMIFAGISSPVQANGPINEKMIDHPNIFREYHSSLLGFERFGRQLLLKREKESKQRATIQKARQWRGDFLHSIHYGLVGAKQVDFKKMSDAVLKSEFRFLAAQGIRNVTLMPVMGQPHRRSSEIKIQENFPGSPSVADLPRIITMAQKQGLSVTFKPYFIVNQGEKIIGSADEIMPSKVWFENYARESIRLAQLAEQAGVPLFIIGNELSHLKNTSSLLENLKALAGQIRQVYRGKIAYAAMTDWFHKKNEPDEKFWNSFDYIGLNFWPNKILSRGAVPTVEEWKRAYLPWFMKADQLSIAMKKSVIITEIGAKAVESMPRCREKRNCNSYWDHTAYAVSGGILKRNNSNQAQINAYKAIKQLLTEFPRLVGVIPWLITPGSIADTRIKNSLGRYFENGFDPRGKTWKFWGKR